MADNGKIIVLAEKPSVGADYARVLGAAQKRKGYFEGGRYIVTWALGHLVELAEPHDYDPRFRQWRMEDLPMLPEEMRLNVIRGTSHQFRTVRELLQRKDVSELVIATDAGREGELVARWIMRLSGWRGPFRRLWISSQTDTAIRAGFATLKPGKSTDCLFQAAVCRAEADWLIGLNVTRALTCRYDFPLSAGRVQTPTLALIIEREKEIKEFQPRDFWTVRAEFSGFFALWRGPKGSRIMERGLAEAIAAKIQGQTGTVTEMRRELKSEPPPLAYDLTELQRDANRQMSFSARHTLSVLQGLYERHKLVTYPRTDSRHITTDMVATLPQRLKAMGTGPYATAAKALLQEKLNPGKRLVDDARVSDHHAIIPTDQPLNLTVLTADERKLYDLIARRFLAVLSAPCQVEEAMVTVTVGGENFMAQARSQKKPGWRAVAGFKPALEKTEDAQPEQAFSPPEKGTRLEVRTGRLIAGKTQPPPRYTEASLLTAMENPGRFIGDQELRESIQAGGLGTPATRAEIIEKLIDNRYIERHGRELAPMSTGQQLIGIVPEDLRSAELTARWEKRLAGIAAGNESGDRFMADIRGHARRLVDLVKGSQVEFQISGLTQKPCPMCGKPLQRVEEKGEKRLRCADRRCGYEDTQSVAASIFDRKKKPGKEKFQDRRLIEQHADNRQKSGVSLGDLLETSLKKKD